MMPKKIVLGVVGFTLVVAGATLAIKDWLFIQMVFRGVIGPLLAVVGLVALSLLKE